MIRYISILVASVALTTFLNSRTLAFDIVMADENLIQFSEQAFTQNVFGNQRTYDKAVQHCEQALQVRIDFVVNATQASDDQRRKLYLAGSGDIHRFFTEYERVKRGMRFGRIPRDEWNAVWQKTRPLSTRFAAGLHGPNSLFNKTISSVLNDSQSVEYAAMQKKRATAIYIDNIRMALSMIDRKVALTRKQRDSIIEMMIKETEPPKYYGQSSMNYYIVLFQMTKLPNAALKSLFEEKEWAIINGMLVQAKGMEQTIKQQIQAIEQ